MLSFKMKNIEIFEWFVLVKLYFKVESDEKLQNGQYWIITTLWLTMLKAPSSSCKPVILNKSINSMTEKSIFSLLVTCYRFLLSSCKYTSPPCLMVYWHAVRTLSDELCKKRKIPLMENSYMIFQGCCVPCLSLSWDMFGLSLNLFSNFLLFLHILNGLYRKFNIQYSKLKLDLFPVIYNFSGKVNFDSLSCSIL